MTDTLTEEVVRGFRTLAYQAGPGVDSFAIRLLAESWLRLNEENERLKAREDAVVECVLATAAVSVETQLHKHPFAAARVAYGLARTHLESVALRNDVAAALAKLDPDNTEQGGGA